MDPQEAKPHSPVSESLLPLFFHQPVALTYDRHRDAGLNKHTNVYFAKDAAAIPISHVEAMEASHHYPIVFSRQDPPGLMVLTGLQQKNLFVDEQGKWEPYRYIPAYVRKYPFAVVELPEEREYLLCVDEASDHFSPREADRPFYQGDHDPTDLCDEALHFSAEFQRQMENTTEFCYALLAAGLVNARDIPISLGDKEILVSGISILDNQAFAELPNDTLLQWREKGWLEMVYAIHASQSNWLHLVEREQTA